MMPKRSASPLTPRKKARSNEPFIQDLPSSFFPVHFIQPLHRQPNSVAIAQVNAPHFNARPRPTNECPSPSAPLTSYLIRIRSTLLPPCRSQFTHYFCDFLRPYLFQLRAPSVPLSSNCLDFPNRWLLLARVLFSRYLQQDFRDEYGSAVGAAQAFQDLREV